MTRFNDPYWQHINNVRMHGARNEADATALEAVSLLDRNNGGAGALWEALVSRAPELSIAAVGYATLPKADPFAFQPQMRGGRQFESQGPRYPHTQVRVEAKNGKYSILDAYNPQAGEIVSQKNTQFWAINPSSGVKYINEAAKKYAPGTQILPTPRNIDYGIAGQPLQGRGYLQIPVQIGPIPQQVLEAARRHDVKIRDVNGRVYNP